MAGARGAPESAAGFLRRALAEPPLDPAVAADVTGELGQALAAHLHPDAPAMLRAAVERAASPEQRCELALRGARALGLGGHFPAAMDVARPVLDDPAGLSAEALVRLEAEYVTNGWTHAATVPESLDRVRRAAPSDARERQRRDGRDDGRRARGASGPAAAARLRGRSARGRLAARHRRRHRAGHQRGARHRDRLLRCPRRHGAPARLADRPRPRLHDPLHGAAARGPPARRRGRRAHRASSTSCPSRPRPRCCGRSRSSSTP